MYIYYISVKQLKKISWSNLTKINTVSKSWIWSSHMQSYSHPVVWLLRIVYSLINKLESQQKNGVRLTHKAVEDLCCVCNIFPFFRVQCRPVSSPAHPSPAIVALVNSCVLLNHLPSVIYCVLPHLSYIKMFSLRDRLGDMEVGELCWELS